MESEIYQSEQYRLLSPWEYEEDRLALIGVFERIYKGAEVSLPYASQKIKSWLEKFNLYCRSSEEVIPEIKSQKTFKLVKFGLSRDYTAVPSSDYSYFVSYSKKRLDNLFIPRYADDRPGHHTKFGRFFPYPECCIKACVDETWLTRSSHENPFKFVPYSPCSADCKETMYINEEMKKIIEKKDPALLAYL